MGSLLCLLGAVGEKGPPEPIRLGQPLRKPHFLPRRNMEALCSSDEMLTKATQLWTMLDDMAENNPKSYCHFMQQQLKEAKQHYAPPEPWLCLKTSILEPTKTGLFINLCRWSRIPAPKSPSEPVLLSPGKMETQSEVYSILDLAYSPSVLERLEDSPPAKDQLIHMSLKYVEEHFNVTLSHSWSVAKFKLKGSLERMRESLGRQEPPLAVPQRTPNKVNLKTPPLHHLLFRMTSWSNALKNTDCGWIFQHLWMKKQHQPLFVRRKGSCWSECL
ncbi:PIH1 domain-containing protein 2 isoform X5 [Erythrolamprus reginae]|uniref:PIH1 domain-containing protein 2 isoform X5 n=1 Tax=Erythrolamprus reginae TaxID=121349 RepID=UPI00396CE279